jgi:sugar fermentation stimulation protein A
MIRYENMVPGTFLARPNRFIAQVDLGGKLELCHVKNTGRCRELLVPGTAVWCQHHDDPKRKTQYSLITVDKQGRLVNLDSQTPNAAAAEWVQNGGLGIVPQGLRREFCHGASRFDLYFELDGQPCLMEVKGVTLERDNVACFPDAPTERGRKHLRGLAKAAGEGWRTYVLFVIQMGGIVEFRPNWATDPGFAQALCDARAAGVQVLAVQCQVGVGELEIRQRVPVCLEKQTGQRTGNTL